MRKTRSALEYLLLSSNAALESCELSGLNRSSNLRHLLRETLQAWIESEVQARIASRLRDCKRSHSLRQHAQAAAPRKLAVHEQLKIEFLPPRIEAPGALVPGCSPLESFSAPPSASPSPSRRLRADDASVRRPPLFSAGATDAMSQVGPHLPCNVTCLPRSAGSTAAAARKKSRCSRGVPSLVTTAPPADPARVEQRVWSSRVQRNRISRLLASCAHSHETSAWAAALESETPLTSSPRFRLNATHLRSAMNAQLSATSPCRSAAESVAPSASFGRVRQDASCPHFALNALPDRTRECAAVLESAAPLTSPFLVPPSSIHARPHSSAYLSAATTDFAVCASVAPSLPSPRVQQDAICPHLASSALPDRTRELTAVLESAAPLTSSLRFPQNDIPPRPTLNPQPSAKTPRRAASESFAASGPSSRVQEDAIWPHRASNAFPHRTREHAAVLVSSASSTSRSCVPRNVTRPPSPSRRSSCPKSLRIIRFRPRLSSSAARSQLLALPSAAPTLLYSFAAA